MPEARLQRTRETLPEGYRFGDARAFVDPGSVRIIYDPYQDRCVRVCLPIDQRPHSHASQK